MSPQSIYNLLYAARDTNPPIHPQLHPQHAKQNSGSEVSVLDKSEGSKEEDTCDTYSHVC